MKDYESINLGPVISIFELQAEISRIATELDEGASMINIVAGEGSDFVLNIDRKNRIVEISDQEMKTPWIDRKADADLNGPQLYHPDHIACAKCICDDAEGGEDSE